MIHQASNCDGMVYHSVVINFYIYDKYQTSSIFTYQEKQDHLKPIQSKYLLLVKCKTNYCSTIDLLWKKGELGFHTDHLCYWFMGFVLFSVRIHRKYINLFRQNLNSLQVTKLLQSPAYKFIKTNTQKNTHTHKKEANKKCNAIVYTFHGSNWLCIPIY